MKNILPHNSTLVFMVVSTLLMPGSMVTAQKSDRPSSPKKLSVNVDDTKVNWTGKKPGQEHTGYVKLRSGEFTLTNNEITGGSFIIDLRSITDVDISDEGMNKKLVSDLKSQHFFDVARYPTAKFVITRITRLPVNVNENPKATHQIEGDLSMKGITKKISFEASINMLKGKLTVNTPPFSLDRTQWGINYQSKSVVADLKDRFIQDDIILSIDLTTD